MCGSYHPNKNNLHGKIRRLMKLGGFFVLLVRDP